VTDQVRSGSSPPLRVLVVDDDAGTRGILNRVLVREFGCEVAEASHGGEALALLERRTFDLIVLDLQMPTMDGIEMLNRLRQVHRHRLLPVIILTADAGEGAVRQTVHLRVTAYLTKPINPRRLAQRLRGLLEQVGQRDQETEATAQNPVLDPKRPVLVADADAGWRSFAAATLGQRVKVLEAESGFKVLQALTLRPGDPVPQLVLLTANTGLLAGATLVERIRQIRLPDELRLVGLFSFAQVEEARRSGLYDRVLVRTTRAEVLLDQFDRLWGEPEPPA
jgi:CheY-like chemotaxis protein